MSLYIGTRISKPIKPVDKLSMYNCNAFLRWALGQQHCFVNTRLKTGIVSFYWWHKN